MGSWEINHPDTLGYHAQIIEWIRDFQIVPGLAHLNLRYGLQSLWFPACALFDFKLPNLNAINLLNFTVVIWYLFFLIKKIDTAFINRQPEGFLWIALLAISLWNYTQIRLTITSASPDFIVSILVWTIIYLLLQPLTIRNLVVATLFCFWAVTIKLSSLPVILMGLYSLFLILKKKNYKGFFFGLIFSVLLFACSIARNIFTSGYLFYPSTFPDIVNADWKINNKLVEQQKKYITVYARTQISFEGEQAEKIYDQKITQWMPAWWKTLSVSDKLILFVFILSFVVTLLFIKRIRTYNKRHKIPFAICSLGVLFWFYLAPDLRFGNGFIIGFIGIASTFFLSRYNSLNKRVLLVSIFLTLFIVAGYTFYRFYSFFSPQQILFPIEITKPINRTVICNGVEIQLPIINQASQSDIDDCKQINLRGRNVTDGFR